MSFYVLFPARKTTVIAQNKKKNPTKSKSLKRDLTVSSYILSSLWDKSVARAVQLSCSWVGAGKSRAQKQGRGLFPAHPTERGFLRSLCHPQMPT